MKTIRNVYAAAFFCVCFLVSPFLSFARLFVDNGSTATYNLSSGDTLRIASGNYRGAIANLPARSVIYITSNGTFTPASISGPMGTIINYGLSDIRFAFGTSAGFRFDNHHLAQFGGAVTAIGNGTATQNWNNYLGSTMVFKNDFSVSNNAIVLNEGNMRFETAFQVNSGSSVQNKSVITVLGTFSTNNNSTFTNLGLITTQSAAAINGTSVFNNNCRFAIEGGLSNYSTINNAGLLWAKAAPAGNQILNYGNIVLSLNSVMKSVRFSNYNTVSGSRNLYFISHTTTSKSSSIGFAGQTADTIRVFDETRTGSSLFDVQGSNSVRPNTVWRAQTPPDTLGQRPGCAQTYYSTIALPVHFTFFHAGQREDSTLLHFGAAYEEGLVFFVERSTDGRRFETAGTLTADPKAVYQFTDRAARPASGPRYYRIKGLSRSGEVKYSEVRTVAAKTVSAAALLSAHYQSDRLAVHFTAATAGRVQLVVQNLNGQVLLVRDIALQAGANHIQPISEARLHGGAYIVLLREKGNLLGSQKFLVP
ncbi:MAG TPA: hypothetical protein VHK69_02615 [Chitinophagaceae bacterium]|jgi:hypothetical protein|nr:hypothetical protein [Chitinophagaceae bacterium]